MNNFKICLNFRNTQARLDFVYYVTKTVLFKWAYCAQTTHTHTSTKLSPSYVCSTMLLLHMYTYYNVVMSFMRSRRIYKSLAISFSEIFHFCCFYSYSCMLVFKHKWKHVASRCYYYLFSSDLKKGTCSFSHQIRLCFRHSL